MDRLDALRLFTRIVELGSFSRAAAELGLPRATATHAIQQLEARLGTRLLERTTRQVRTTAEGQAFHDRCVQILSDLEEAEARLGEGAARPRGTLRVEIHGSHAVHVVLPRIGEFHARYPDLELVVSSGDRLVDLVREGIDCAIRAGHPRDSTLVARRLALLREAVCASPAYLARHGVPTHPEQLVSHRAVGFFASSRDDIDYPFEFLVDGAPRRYDVRGWIKVSDAPNYLACALAGHGLIQVPTVAVEPHLRDGSLVEVLADWPSPWVPVSLLYPQHRQPSARLRVFIEWVSQVYRERFGERTVQWDGGQA